MMGNTVKYRVPIMHDGKYSQSRVPLSMMGNTVKSRVPIIHDGK
jgi:hypothetical protein